MSVCLGRVLKSINDGGMSAHYRANGECVEAWQRSYRSHRLSDLRLGLMEGVRCPSRRVFATEYTRKTGTVDPVDDHDLGEGVGPVPPGVGFDDRPQHLVYVRPAIVVVLPRPLVLGHKFVVGSAARRR